MRIEPRAPIAGGAAVRSKPATGPRFTPDAGQPTSAGATTRSSSLIGLDAVLALQSDQQQDEGKERRKRAARRGHDLLDSLEQLKLSLLSGRVAAQDIARLTRQMQEASAASGDARIDELLAHIELRARVELAKLAPR